MVGIYTDAPVGKTENKDTLAASHAMSSGMKRSGMEVAIYEINGEQFFGKKHWNHMPPEKTNTLEEFLEKASAAAKAVLGNAANCEENSGHIGVYCHSFGTKGKYLAFKNMQNAQDKKLIPKGFSWDGSVYSAGTPCETKRVSVALVVIDPAKFDSIEDEEDSESEDDDCHDVDDEEGSESEDDDCVKKDDTPTDKYLVYRIEVILLSSSNKRQKTA